MAEIGTALGILALSLLAGMTSDGALTSIDFEVDNWLSIRSFPNAVGYPPSRYRLITGASLEILPKLRDDAYDIVFINGNKLEYVEYMTAALCLLCPGGLPIIHDVL